ncbi:hypothetical protein GQ53DRAFT_663510 [Thozetella sp. PMI_491]|nr:hypothetical protein GQ53DRAFT_663510 [Thozetella sp. PMI_491]
MSETASSSKEVKPLLTVYTIDKDPKKYSLVSFATKLHFRLRYAGIPYIDGVGSRGEAPKDKIPYVKFHSTNELLGDSALIIKRLIEMGKTEDLTAGLSPETRATDFSFRSMIDEKMYFLLLYERWYENYKEMRDHGPLAHLPGGIRHVAVAVLLQYVRLMLYFQGTGRHKLDEIKHLRGEAIAAMADFATVANEMARDRPETEPFWILGGPKPTEADFSLFGYLSGLLVTPTQPATVALIRQSPALMSYVQRIHKTYFSDFNDIV